MAVLITGGAGYIGSVMVEQLVARGEEVVVLDDLSRGHRRAVSEGLSFYQGCIGNRELVKRICEEHSIESCVHFAALAYVGESVTNPKLYFENNVEQGIALLDMLLAKNVRRVVFSSTCATYGEPISIPMDEHHPQEPTSPYGWSKLIMEKVLQAYDHAYGLKYVALRYFNAAGATGTRGEHHEHETHLIPNVLFAALGKLPHVSVFGNQYSTPDGTAIRDYVHVADLCAAHGLALDYLRNSGSSECVNLGNGRGYSVMEIIEKARLVTNCKIETNVEPPRPGDPSRLIANPEKAQSLLGWSPKHSEIGTILNTAWDWHRAHPHGYAAG